MLVNWIDDDTATPEDEWRLDSEGDEIPLWYDYIGIVGIMFVCTVWFVLVLRALDRVIRWAF